MSRRDFDRKKKSSITLNHNGKKSDGKRSGFGDYDRRKEKVPGSFFSGDLRGAGETKIGPTVKSHRQGGGAVSSTIFRKGAGADDAEWAGDGVESGVRNMKSGGGAKLPERERAYYENRFGHSFEDVRIHTGEQARELSGSIQAKAFTMGSDIAFAKGEYDPSSSQGKRLIAHELAHVVQQGAAPGVQRQNETVVRPSRDTTNEPGSRQLKVGDIFNLGGSTYYLQNGYAELRNEKGGSELIVKKGKMVELVGQGGVRLFLRGGHYSEGDIQRELRKERNKGRAGGGSNSGAGGAGAIRG